jgi:hypothetical protein
MKITLNREKRNFNGSEDTRIVFAEGMVTYVDCSENAVE